MENQTSNATVNLAMEGYFSILKLEHIKLDYDVITKEFDRLNNKLDKLYESTDRKRKNIFILKEKQEMLKLEYNRLYSIVEVWLNFVFQTGKEDYLKATKEYYSKIEIKKDAFQKVINRLFPPITRKLTEIELEQLKIAEKKLMSKEEKLKLADDEMEDGIQYEIFPRYYAGNIRQDIHRAWKNQIEGK